MDDSGASLSGARVSLYQNETSSPSTMITRGGLFEFPATAAGNYRVVVEKNGFAPFEMRDIRIAGDQPEGLSIRLKRPR
jgi:hypothetical protein